MTTGVTMATIIPAIIQEITQGIILEIILEITLEIILEITMVTSKDITSTAREITTITTEMETEIIRYVVSARKSQSCFPHQVQQPSFCWLSLDIENCTSII